MYLSLIITFLLLLVIIITAIQNSMPLEVKFIAWNDQMSLTALIFYSSLFSVAIEAGDEIGTQTSKAVRSALTSSIKGAEDVIEPPPDIDKV